MEPGMPTATATFTVPHGKATRRAARRAVLCTWGDCRRIEPGEVYVEMVTYPGHESGYADYAGKPVRMACCVECCRNGVFDRKPLAQLVSDLL
jgi:hypothetical protein